MNETKVYKDSYCAVFREQKDFLECIRSRMENSCWDRRKSKTLRLAALTEESPIADQLREKYAREGMDEDIIKDTISNTGLVLRVRNEYYPVRSCAIKSILDRAGINGAGLRRVERNVYARILNECLKVAQGDAVIALGNIFGYADGMSYGVVSASNYKATFFDGECAVIATDIPAEEQGTGMLFNMDGEVVGMISSSVWNDTGKNVVNAYGISDLKPIIELLINGKSVPYIGIYGTTVTEQLAEEHKMPSGIYVADVDPDSPAMAAGIQIGDIICEASGEEIKDIAAYQNIVIGSSVGETMEFVGKRLGSDGYVNIKFSVVTTEKEEVK